MGGRVDAFKRHPWSLMAYFMFFSSWKPKLTVSSSHCCHPANLRAMFNCQIISLDKVGLGLGGTWKDTEQGKVLKDRRSSGQLSNKKNLVFFPANCERCQEWFFGSSNILFRFQIRRIIKPGPTTQGRARFGANRTIRRGKTKITLNSESSTECCFEVFQKAQPSENLWTSAKKNQRLTSRWQPIYQQDEKLSLFLASD